MAAPSTKSLAEDQSTLDSTKASTTTTSTTLLENSVADRRVTTTTSIADTAQAGAESTPLPAAITAQKQVQVVENYSPTWETLASTSTPTTTVATIPTYEDSETSDYYVLAKRFLNEGNFEHALETIESGIEHTKAVLVQAANAASEQDADTTEANDDDPWVLHPSMAPLHYLYGTTLLYSIEESNDAQAVTTTVSNDEDNNNANDNSNADNHPEGGSGENEGEMPPDPTEDMEIAWENLDTARTILEKMIDETNTTVDQGHLMSRTEKYQLDLAQVYLREGDLQRLNGRYDYAVRDYDQCLKLRISNASLPPYHRKIADVHYNLGLSYMMQVVEAKSSTAAPAVEPTLDEDELEARWRRSCFHYYQCARTLSGLIAQSMEVNVAEFLQKAEEAMPKFKSTGDNQQQDGMDHPKVASGKLQILRQHVALLHQASSEDRRNNASLELVELLDEIQETIDEAESSITGVQQVTALKESIAAAVAGEENHHHHHQSITGGTTSIGFGPNGGSATLASAVAQPIMTVRKKKRNEPSDPSKRVKTE